MLQNHHWIIMVGGILTVVGIILFVVLIFSAIEDPSDEAEWEGYFSSGGQEKQATLHSDDYEVWCEGLNDPGQVTIKNGDDVVIFRDSSSSGNRETITINNKEYRKVGELNIDRSDTYTISTERSGQLYITPPMDIFSSIATICVVGIVPVIGVIFLLVGGTKWFIKKEASRAAPAYPGQPPQARYSQAIPTSPSSSLPPTTQPAHLPSTQPSTPPPAPQSPPPPPPPPSEKQICQICGEPLSYIEEYQSWYCYNCRTYTS